MIILGRNRYYIEGFLCVLRESALCRFHRPEEYADLRIYVLSGMSQLHVHQMLASYPPSHASIFILSERQTSTIRALFPRLIKYLVPENTRPEDLLRDMISAVRMKKFCQDRDDGFSRPDFSPIQKAIIPFIVKGSRTSDIGSALNISYKTVYSHRYNIFKIMGVKNLTDFYFRWCSLKQKRDQDIINIVYTPSEGMSEEVSEQ